VDSERHLLTVHRYIELNPVRAAMTPTAEDHRWSNAPASLALAADSLLTFHPLYLAMGADPIQRGDIYRQWLQQGISEDDLQGIRSHLRQERALGHPRFQAMVEKTLNRPASIRPRGRPRKTEVLAET
jgi:putative transposase